MALKDLLEKKLKNWKGKQNKDEWFFPKLSEEILYDRSSEEAFNMIQELTDIVLNEKDEYLRGELFLLLTGAVNKSRTTEIPKYLLERWEDLKESVVSISPYYEREFDWLRRWYRLHESEKVGGRLSKNLKKVNS